MVFVLAVSIGACAVISLWKLEIVKDIYFADVKTYILNGVIVLLFGLGLGQLVRGFRHYAVEEQELARFVVGRADGIECEGILADPDDTTLIARRYFTVKDLFRRGVPINHSAISSIMVAEESLYQSFPRFVNNVLILTGVFGTVSSLIFALIGASNVLQSALPGEGMGVMLLGMNTALTTTATAIVCYFFFTYFYQKLTDVQTHLFSQIERAVLIHVIPEFAFDSESINHQTQSLVREVRKLIGRLHDGVGNIEQTLTGLGAHNDAQMEKWDTVLGRQDALQEQVNGILSYSKELQRVLVEGFRLR